MIATHYLTEWAASHPWKLSEQVEQDLLISRAEAFPPFGGITADRATVL